MKKVETAFRDKISDLILENDLTISEFALEKDFIVTDVLHAISKINNEKFNFVFVGVRVYQKPMVFWREFRKMWTSNLFQNPELC